MLTARRNRDDRGQAFDLDRHVAVGRGPVAKLAVEVVPPRQTDAEGRITEKPKSTVPAEDAAVIPGDAGSDSESIRGDRKWNWVWAGLAKVQARCEPGNAVKAHHRAHQQSSKPGSPTRTIHPPMVVGGDLELKSQLEQAGCPTKKAVAWRERFKKVSAVPAFASPLTPVLNPIVGRAQWEIVVRSAVMAMVVSLVIVGVLLSVPVKKE